MTRTANRQWILTQRPTGEPSTDDFDLVETAVENPGPNEILVRDAIR
jgi:NADPH-dependent curcumin reductase CurA